MKHKEVKVADSRMHSTMTHLIPIAFVLALKEQAGDLQEEIFPLIYKQLFI